MKNRFNKAVICIILEFLIVFSRYGIVILENIHIPTAHTETTARSTDVPSFIFFQQGYPSFYKRREELLFALS